MLSGPPRADPAVAGLVLAAGGSRRLGSPKQLLLLDGSPLLERTVAVARACRFGQLVCVLGAHAAAIRVAVDLSGVEVVENPHYGAGCSSSIAAGIGTIDRGVQTLVLLLGDQPGVTPDTVAALLAGRGDAAIAVCQYDDGRGHPLAFSRSLFAELGALHGDKGVWKLLDRYAAEVVEVPIAGRVPPDVDTWEAYAAVARAERTP
jgi:molybdenum cofactor cytidylyltransferase